MPSCPGMGLTCKVTALQTSGIPSPSGPQMPLETLVLASFCLLVSSHVQLTALLCWENKSSFLDIIHSLSLVFLTPICEDPEPSPQ